MSQGVAALNDEGLDQARIWGVRAIVAVHAGDDAHWEINDDGDVEVSVVTAEGGPITAILVAQGGGGGRGFWAIPPVGAEVVVQMPDDYEGEAYIVGGAASGTAPAGLSDTRAVLIQPELAITATDGKLELEASGNVEAVGAQVVLGADGLTQPTVRGTAYRSAEDVMLSAIQAFIAAVVPGAISPATAALAVTAAGAIATFQAAASTYLTTIVKVR